MSDSQPKRRHTPKQIELSCDECGAIFCRKPTTQLRRSVKHFCSNDCKAKFQKRAKPVDRDWLYEKYIVEGLDCVAIGKMVNRDPKSVWNWLVDFGIPTRPRGSYFASQPWFSFWMHAGDSPMKGRKLSAETRKIMSDIAKAKGRVPFDPAVGSYMKGRKGADVPSWRGGVTPERQAFYSSQEWKAVVPMVWARDRKTCQHCGRVHGREDRGKFDIHHIVSFECRELRAELSNLVFLCEACHYWVHSNNNVDHLFIKEVNHAA